MASLINHISFGLQVACGLNSAAVVVTTTSLELRRFSIIALAMCVALGSYHLKLIIREARR